MISVPTEILIWAIGGALSAIFAMFTVCAHLLIGLKTNLTDIAREQGLQAAEMRFLKQLYMQDKGDEHDHLGRTSRV